jgi:hypothetical protein
MWKIPVLWEGKAFILKAISNFYINTPQDGKWSL